MRPVTLSDIAARTNLTKAAVSFALNGNRGVSEETRQRVLAVAAELGYRPNNAARALLSGTSGAVGLIINRPGHMLGVEPFYMRLISGIQAELADRNQRYSLLMAVVDGEAAELELYNDWWAQRRVDGVFLVDVRRDDHRGALLERLGLPTVALANQGDTRQFPAVWHADADAMQLILDRLVGLGHRRIARVAGISGLSHTRRRTASFVKHTRRLGVSGIVRTADYTAPRATSITTALLKSVDPPTAIVYDNDVMALAGLGAAVGLGVRVPAELSIVAWDDSTLCRLVRPEITALRWNTERDGARAADLLLRAIARQPTPESIGEDPELIERGSTGPSSR